MPASWNLKADISGLILDLIYKADASKFIQENRSRSNIPDNCYSNYRLAKCDSESTVAPKVYI
jgi:hypothetical protein